MSPAAGPRRSRGSIKDRAGTSEETKGQRTTCKRPWEKSCAHKSFDSANTKVSLAATASLSARPDSSLPASGLARQPGPIHVALHLQIPQCHLSGLHRKPLNASFVFFFPSRSLKASAPQITHKKKARGCSNISPVVAPHTCTPLNLSPAEVTPSSSWQSTEPHRCPKSCRKCSTTPARSLCLRRRGRGELCARYAACFSTCLEGTLR